VLQRSARELLACKDLMVHDANHRIGSSLSLVAAVLRLQANSATPDARWELETAAARVVALGELHRDLARSGAVSYVQISDYLTTLGRGLERATGTPDRPLAITVEADVCELPGAKASRAGLVASELMMNAIEHGCAADGSCAVTVRFSVEAGIAALAVSNWGRGLPEDFDLTKAPGPGMTLIRSLIGHLGGELAVERLELGTRFTVRFPI
jgi:two-component sensor histidine kinase